MWESLKNLALDILDSVLTLAGDVLIFLLDLVMKALVVVLSTILSPLDISALTSAIAQVPPEMFDFAYRLGLKEVSAIIIGALMVRFTLQLIPFIRTGS